jgi:hypothetical protein
VDGRVANAHSVSLQRTKREGEFRFVFEARALTLTLTLSRKRARAIGFGLSEIVRTRATRFRLEANGAWKLAFREVLCG